MPYHRDQILIINAWEEPSVILGLSSEVRIRILDLLSHGSRNVNEIAADLKLPQSTVATNVAILEETGLLTAESTKARKGSQKICSRRYEEILIRFEEAALPKNNLLEVSMPIGLYTNYEISPPCGLCSHENVIGFLDVPDSFLSPDRMKASLIWFEKGWIEYKFPNNSLYKEKSVAKIEVSTELSSETPGTDPTLLSDITMWINDIEIGQWTSPGDFGDKRGKLTPLWWKLEGSQYGLLKNWSVTDEGAFVDGVQISGVRLSDLSLSEHHSIKVKLGVKDDAEHLGGMNLFGKGFGNYDQDILVRLYFDE